jgi:hypothetical protein
MNYLKQAVKTAEEIGDTRLANIARGTLKAFGQTSD